MDLPLNRGLKNLELDNVPNFFRVMEQTFDYIKPLDTHKMDLLTLVGKIVHHLSKIYVLLHPIDGC